MTAWVPVRKPAVEIMAAVPTRDLVRRCGLQCVPGIRLSKDGLAVVDSQGFFTRFYSGPGGLTYVNVIDPKGFTQWLQELRVLPKKGADTDE